MQEIFSNHLETFLNSLSETTVIYDEKSNYKFHTKDMNDFFINSLKEFINEKKLFDDQFFVNFEKQKNSLVEFFFENQTYQLNVQLKQLTWENKNFSFFLVKLVNMTYLKSLEIEIEKNYSEQVNKMKMLELAEISASIAHEINNPLTVILAKSILIKKISSEGTFFSHQDKVLDSVDKVIHHSERIAKIVKGLRVLSTQPDSVELAASNLSDILEEAIYLLIEKIKNKGIIFSFNKSSQKFMIMCKKELIHQTILNLINNAIDAVENKAGAKIEISLKLDKKIISLNVIDNGEGVSQLVKEKMFAPFFTTKSAGQGTGLGLSVTQKIIHQHHGKLIYSRLNQLTYFSIQLNSIE